MNWLTVSVVYLTRNKVGSLGTYLSAVLFKGFALLLFHLSSTSLFLLLWYTFLNLCVLVGFLIVMVKCLYFWFLEKTVHYEEFPAPLLWSRSTIVIGMHSRYHCHVPASSSSCLASCALHATFVASISRALWKGSSCICISDWHYLPRFILDDCCHANHVRVSGLFICNLQKWNPPFHPWWSVSGYFCLFEHFCQSFCLTLRDCNNLSCGTETLCGRGHFYVRESLLFKEKVITDKEWWVSIFASATWPRNGSAMVLLWMSFRRMWHVSSSKAVECICTICACHPASEFV